MASETLNSLQVAILVTDSVEHVEMIEPRKALRQAGVETRLVTPEDGRLKVWNFTAWGDSFTVAVPFDCALPEDFDALLLPSGIIHPDRLRTLPEVVAFVKRFLDAGKPVASICSGPWTIIPADADLDRHLASGKSDNVPAFEREVVKLVRSAGREPPRETPEEELQPATVSRCNPGWA